MDSGCRSAARRTPGILERFGDSADCHKNQDFDIVLPACTKGTGSQHPGGVRSRSARASMRCTRLGIRERYRHAPATLGPFCVFSYSPDEAKAVTTDCVDKAYELIRSFVKLRRSSQVRAGERRLPSRFRAPPPPTPLFHAKHPLPLLPCDRYSLEFLCALLLLNPAISLERNQPGKNHLQRLACEEPAG